MEITYQSNNMEQKTQTPFLSIDKEVILIGDLIYEINDSRGNPKERKEPLTVSFGEYKAGRDDWSIDFIVHGFYVKFQDGGVYSLTQEGNGYSISAGNCKIINNEQKLHPAITHISASPDFLKNEKGVAMVNEMVERASKMEFMLIENTIILPTDKSSQLHLWSDEKGERIEF